MKELLIALAITCVAVLSALRIQAWYPLYGSEWLKDIRKRRRRAALKRLQRLSEKMGLYDNGDSK